MAEDSPISHDVTDPVTVETNADPAQVGDINKSFQDFWAQEDSKATEPTEAAPAAPGQSDAGAAQETRKQIASTEAPAEPPPKAAKAPAQKPPETKSVEPLKPSTQEQRQFSDDEIDRLALPANARPEFVEHFKNVKAAWKADRAKMETLRGEVDKLSAELTDAKNNAWTPEARADYEHAAQIRRRFDFVSDPEFVQKFHAPIRNRYEAVLDEAVSVLPDQAAAQEWAQFIKANYQPDQLNRQWWLRSVIEKVPNELDRQALLGSVTELLRMQKERDQEISRRTNDKSAFDNWIQEKTQTTAQRVHQEIMAEIGEQEKRIAEVLPRDANSAKNAEERAAIEAHNERFKGLNQFFTNTMQDLSKNGPRAWVRASVEATRAHLLEQEYNKLKEEADSIRSERDQLKSELDKIHNARRRLSHTSGAPSTQPKPSQGLSLKDGGLDVRKAFESFDWDNSSSNR